MSQEKQTSSATTTLSPALAAAPSPAFAQDDICNLGVHDPGTWDASKTGEWLENWFKEHNYDEHDWLRKMDIEVTGNGEGNSILDCKGLYGAGTCYGPQNKCNTYDPKQFFYVRQVAAQFNQYLTWAHEMLQDYSISNGFALDGLITDLDIYKDVRNGDWLTQWLTTFSSRVRVQG
ncbi:hypothetical protein BJX70DRAFT_402796 [Aspergillus crustosus]